MGDKDITEKILADYNDVFADIINVLIFNGESRVAPEELVNTGVRSMYKSDKRRLHEQERDIAKIWNKCNIEVALCGIENQTKAEKLMPLRIFGYEGASYRSQYLKSKKDVYPVITIILYYGEEHWNYNKSLKSLLNIPQGMEDYVNDCKINVFEVSFLSSEQIEMFHSDFKIVANFFVNRRMHKDYIYNDPQTIQHVDELLKLLSAMTGDYRYEEILSTDEGKQVKNMCEVYDRVENIGIAKGIEQGIKQGQMDIIQKFVASNMPIEKIAKICDMSVEEIKKLASLD